MKHRIALLVCLLLTTVGCSPEPEGLARAIPADTTVRMDFFADPLPEIALPNDIATRFDETSPTGRRINASMIAETIFESKLRRNIDRLDGWGVMQAITIPFTGSIDPMSIVSRHSDVDYDTDDDAIYVVNISRESPRFGELHHLDFGNGNYPVVLERRDIYWKNDPRGTSMSLFYEEADEDRNRNGVLDPGAPGVPPEDTDADGILDQPNYLPGLHPGSDDLAGRTDALMTFYERSTNTLIGRPLVPFDDRTTYAVIVTRRVLDAGGEPVGSPYPYVHHVAQTEELRPLMDVLPKGLRMTDIAFVFPFTTQTIRADWQALRDGLYGRGVQAHLGDGFPAVVDELLPMRDPGFFTNMKMPHILPSEVWGPALAQINQAVFGETQSTASDALAVGSRYVDFYSIGRFESPQLFQRFDENGERLPLNEQIWPPDLASQPADARSETVYFTLSVPRKEISARGQGKPAPVVVVGHGYTSNRFEVMQFSSYLAQHGFAVIGIDGPSHGIGIPSGDQVIATALLTGMGIGGATEALISDRAEDLDFDGVKDSGADFWTSYLFHTRDMVRQFTLDYMQLVRMIRGFDGVQRWDFDLDGDGQNEIAGDFDADGQLDISVDSEIYVFGGSLGGIMSMVLGAIEPAVQAIAPVSGGGGYGDMGPRSTQNGVYQAFILRVMGPLIVADGNEKTLEMIVVDLNREQTIKIADIEIEPWDTMVVDNLRNGERRCAYVQEDLTARAASESDLGDRLVVSFYRGPILDPTSEHCDFMPGQHEPYAVHDTFADPFVFQAESIEAGSPLVSYQEGIGMRRSHPDFRRLGGLGQLILDPADPVVLARNLLIEPLSYATGETTGAHSLIITTMGDTSVPVSGGAAVGRAAGIIPYLEPDDRHGMPTNQVLIDTHTLEGVHNLNRYVNPAGEGVHLDLENFSGGDDMFGSDIPRYETPPRIGFDDIDALGGKSAAIFPYNVPTGQHGFDLPGGMTDRCIRALPDEQCPAMGACECDGTFDIGYFMLNMVGFYFKSGGNQLRAEPCMSTNDCPDILPPPEPRDPNNLY